MYLVSSFLFFLAIISTSVCRSRFIQKRDAEDDAYMNVFVRSVIGNMMEEMLAKQGNVMDLPNYSDTFDLAFFTGRLSAADGRMGDLSTLNIVNLTVSTTQNSLTVFVQVEIKHLEIEYNDFEASVRFFSFDGSFNAIVGSNLLTIQVTLKQDGTKCEASLDRFNVKFEDFNLKIYDSNASVSNSLVSKVATIVANKCIPELETLAEEKGRELVLPYVSLACEFWLPQNTT